MVEASYEEGLSTSEIEGRFFSYSHAVVGAAVLNEWNFSRSLIMSTLHHEDLQIAVDEEEDGEELLRLTATINFADHVCLRLGIGQREADDQLDLLRSPGARILKLDAAEVENAVAEVEEVINANRDFFIG